MQQRNKVIFIAGSFGSGTSAVAGALAKLGVSSLPPHFQTNDPRTPSSFESLAFRKLVDSIANDADLSVADNRAGTSKFIKELKKLVAKADGGIHDAVMLKMPLASLCLPQIVEAVDPFVIVVHRPFDEIEASRNRRNWPAHYGAVGAQRIYYQLTWDLIKTRKSFLALSYSDLRQHGRREITRIAQFCGLKKANDRIGEAVKFIRRE